ADGIYAIPGVSLIFFLSFWFGQQFKDLVEMIEKDVTAYRPIIILAALVAVGIYLFFHFVRKPVPTGDPKELPLIGQQVAATMEHLSPHAESAAGNSSPIMNGKEAGSSAAAPQPVNRSASEPSGR